MRKKRGLRIALLSIGGVVVLAIAASIVVPMVQQMFLPKPAETVTQFLTAVAESDAETALSFVDLESVDHTDLLTDEVLATSNAAHPLTDITVGEPTKDDYFWDVPVTYRFGDVEREQTFRVAQASPDSPKGTVLGGANSVFVPIAAQLSPTINGVAVKRGVRYAALPGVYEFAIDSPHLTIGESTPNPESPAAFDPTAVVIDRTENAQRLSSITSVPTSQAVTAVRQLVAARLTQCAQSKARTTDCGLSVPDEFGGAMVPIEGTVVRTLAPKDQALIDKSTLRRVDDSDPFHYKISSALTMSTTCSAMWVDRVRIDARACRVVFAKEPVVDLSAADIQLEWQAR